MLKKLYLLLVSRIISFKFAINGIFCLIRSQKNAQIHLIATTLTLIISFVLKISVNDWCIIIFAILIVWISEALNTAIELLCDLVSPEYNLLIKKSKDVAAGAVLISAIGALIVGVLTFKKYLLF